MSDVHPIAEVMDVAKAPSLLDSLWMRAAVVLVISVVALIPCFWLPHLEAGDLGSHLYNAWLTQLVEKGLAPGLWVAPQTTNVLFDILLLHLGSLLGFAAAEKLAVCLAVLVFLWGAFSLVSAMGGRLAWFLLPLLVMFSYGWTFEMGFFNFYLCLGMGFFALSVLWRARGFQYLYVLPIVPLIWLAHPMGFAWFAAVALYILLARILGPRLQILLAATPLIFVVALHFYLARHYELFWWQGSYVGLLGTDQIVLGARYRFLLWMIVLVIAACVVLHFLRTPRKDLTLAGFFPLSLQLYVIGFVTLALLPDAIRVPWYSGMITQVISRFPLAVAIVGCGVLSRLRPRILFGALSGVIAISYFMLVYQDAAKTNRLEEQADVLVAMLPQGSRVITTIYPFRNFRIFVHHVVDRACIGHCFNIANYEPSSKAFRLRANPGNRFVAASDDDANRMMLGDYVVQPDDLPLWQIYQCGPMEVDLCLRPLRAGSLLNNTQNEIVRARPLPQK
jgi:hypothetical protein